MRKERCELCGDKVGDEIWSHKWYSCLCQECGEQFENGEMAVQKLDFRIGEVE